jgi:23S rRNA pseudouridine1911/1915/1917 synthase
METRKTRKAIEEAVTDSLRDEEDEKDKNPAFSAETPPDAEVLLAADDVSPQRLDIFLSRRLGVTRAFAQRLLRSERVTLETLETLDGRGGIRPPVKPSRIVRGGDAFSVVLPPVETLDLLPQDIPFEVVHEDSALIVLNKPAGLVVHPAPGHRQGTLVHGLLHRYPRLGPFNNTCRPGIVHRLDAATSGLMIVARTPEAMTGLQRAFKERAVAKTYLALARGAAKSADWVAEAPIGRDPAHRLRMAAIDGGRQARTEFHRIWTRSLPLLGPAALIACNLVTGRTHQIRVHLSAAGHPIFGDSLYGGSAQGVCRLLLHSWRLSFPHPITCERLSFVCPLPAAFSRYLSPKRNLWPIHLKMI